MQIFPVVSSKPYQRVRVPLNEVIEWGHGSALPNTILLEELGWTLHEFDFETGNAVLCDLGPETELFTVGFSYQRQVSAAKRIATLPFSEFIALTENLCPPQRLIHLFNIGHCGSTLLHNVLNEGGAAWSLSEPKFTNDLALNRYKISVDMQFALARAGLKFLSRLPQLEKRPALVLKHFSQATKLFEIWTKADPQARSIFMYRDAQSWCNSRYGFLQRKNISLDLTAETRFARWAAMSVETPDAYLDSLVDMKASQVNFDELAAVTWCQMIEEFFIAREHGIRMPAFRYDELLNNKVGTLRNIFNVCNLPTSGIEKSLVGFERDSHEGEVTARDKPALKFSADAIERIDKILSNPRFQLDPFVML